MLPIGGASMLKQLGVQQTPFIFPTHVSANAGATENVVTARTLKNLFSPSQNTLIRQEIRGCFTACFTAGQLLWLRFSAAADRLVRVLICLLHVLRLVKNKYELPTSRQVRVRAAKLRVAGKPCGWSHNLHNNVKTIRH